MGRLRRFLHLERERAGAKEPDLLPSVAERFANAGDSPPVTPALRHAPLGRFAPPETSDRFAPPADPQVELELAHEEDGRKFVRCAYCGCDHHVSARACTSCGRDLGSAMQKTFNEDLGQQLDKERQTRERAAEVQRREVERQVVEQVQRRLRDFPGDYYLQLRDWRRLRLREHPLVQRVASLIVLAVMLLIMWILNAQELGCGFQKWLTPELEPGSSDHGHGR